MPDVNVFLSPDARGKITVWDMISPEGTIELWVEGGPMPPGTLFGIHTNAYHLECGFSPTSFVIMRNGLTAEIPCPVGSGDTLYGATWAPTELTVLALGEDYGKAVKAKPGSEDEEG